MFPCDYSTLLQIFNMDDSLRIPKNSSHRLLGYSNGLRLFRRTFTRLRLLFGLGYVVVDPGLVHSHKSTPNILHIVLKHC